MEFLVPVLLTLLVVGLILLRVAAIAAFVWFTCLAFGLNLPFWPTVLCVWLGLGLVSDTLRPAKIDLGSDN